VGYAVSAPAPIPLYQSLIRVVSLAKNFNKQTSFNTTTSF